MDLLRQEGLCVTTKQTEYTIRTGGQTRAGRAQYHSTHGLTDGQILTGSSVTFRERQYLLFQQAYR